MKNITHMKIDYKSLRKIKSGSSQNGSFRVLKGQWRYVAEVAGVFGIQRPVVYDIRKKQADGNLNDRSKAPKSSPSQLIMVKKRSHRTDDDEFYIPRVFKIKSEEDLLEEALKYLYYYNSLREHSSLNYKLLAQNPNACATMN